MTNDPSSAGNGAIHAGQSPHASDGASQTLGNEYEGQQAAGLALGQFPSQLTQELAQLLAASIAQQSAQPGFRAQAGGTPTGAELASLAAMMASTQATRKPLPRFQDELSTLNYSRRSQVPATTPLHQVPEPYPAPAANTHAEVHDDEPMPIPSTWRQPAAHEEDRPFAKQLGAAVMGLAAGLVVVVPVVLWMTGYIGGFRSRNDDGSDVKTAKVRPFDRYSEASAFPSDATAPPSTEPQPLTTASMTKVPSVDPAQHTEHLLVQARQRIDGGDVMAAREILAGDSQPSALVLFALAETYDPNMLAAWGSRGVSADVQRARSLYGRALDMGHGRAQPRLDALK